MCTFPRHDLFFSILADFCCTSYFSPQGEIGPPGPPGNSTHSLTLGPYGPPVCNSTKMCLSLFIKPAVMRLVSTLLTFVPLYFHYFRDQ